MNVLHINTWSIGSGAPIAAKRHCDAMNRHGINASILYLEKKQNSDVYFLYNGGLIHFFFKVRRFIVERLIKKITHKCNLWDYTTIDNDITKLKIFKEADIVYLHWVCGQFLSSKSIERVLKTGKPIVWYLHDMFSFTGGCHYSYDCNKYKEQCKDCPQLSFLKKLANRQLLSRIKHTQNYRNLIISAPSQWILNMSLESRIFHNHKHIVCRNLIDENIFFPQERDSLLIKKGLEPSKKYILLSVYSTKLLYKGFKYLLEALSELEMENTELLIMGNVSDPNVLSIIKLPYHLLGYMTSPNDVAKAYNMADVLVVPSIQENFPNVIIEAFACSLPVVAFNVGGIPEQVIHKQTGWLAEVKDAKGLAEGIKWVLENTVEYQLKKNCLNYFLENCSFSSVWKNHQPLFDLVK